MTKQQKTYLDELKWLYMELYRDENAFAYFLTILEKHAADRKAALRKRDDLRAAGKSWDHETAPLGMMLYTENFGGTLRGVEERLPYLTECGIDYLHLMPLLDSPHGKSDGGYAVSDFRRVRPDLGTMEDLESLTDACHEHGIAVCFDFVLNHVSEEHAWAKAAKAGDPTAQSRFFMYDSWDIPNAYEATVPQVFPATAPGNFSWVPECGRVVMTTFHPFQWDLNYANPMVFNDMTDNLLYLANRGIDVIRLDAIPYIWKELGTNCRNLPQVHTIVRMMNLACRIVCPGVLLLGEVVMEPKEVVPYFGKDDKAECEMLYNVTMMCTLWNTVVTRDVRLLQHQMEQVYALPTKHIFQNYIRCHDDIGWGLDYPFLGQFGFGEVPHKKYLNDWFTGKWPGSWSRGELYNDFELIGDARLCGTTASLCGIEAALAGLKDGSGDPADLERSIRCDLMLHAFILMQNGIPVLYSGDEIGQLNDYSYHDDPEKWDDSRYLHRGAFDFEKAAERRVKGTVQQKIFDGLAAMQAVRHEYEVMGPDARMSVLWTGNDRVMAVQRVRNGQLLVGLFNFSEWPITVPVNADAELAASDAEWKDLLSGETFGGNKDDEGEELRIPLEGYGFRWLLCCR